METPETAFEQSQDFIVRHQHHRPNRSAAAPCCRVSRTGSVRFRKPSAEGFRIRPDAIACLWAKAPQSPDTFACAAGAGVSTDEVLFDLADPMLRQVLVDFSNDPGGSHTNHLRLAFRCKRSCRHCSDHERCPNQCDNGTVCGR